GPIPGLVPGDEQDRLPLGVKNKQDPQLRAARGARPELLHIPVPGRSHGVHEWTTELRAVLLQHFDCGEYLRPGPIIQRRDPDFDRARVYVPHNTSVEPARSMGNAEQREPGPRVPTATDISTSQDVDHRQGAPISVPPPLR